MLFPVVADMPRKCFERFPSTNNAHESMHITYYQISDTENCLSFGFQLLILFAYWLENRYESLIGINEENEIWKVKYSFNLK